VEIVIQQQILREIQFNYWVAKATAHPNPKKANELKKKAK
jgi:hypothetical protein